MESEIRKDYIQDKYVIIAPRRTDRPRTERLARQEKVPPASKCHFCPKNLKASEVVATFGPGVPWNIAVVENAFPAVTLDNPKAYGTQEVVIETAEHDLHLEDMHEEQIAQLLEVYSVRTKSLMELRGIEYILIFKNSGGKAGASMAHAHSQIFATSFLPPHLLDKSQRGQAYKLKHGSCVYCDTIGHERIGPRKIYEDDFVVAFTPYASFYNYEVWILPKRHIDNVTMLSEEERHAFAFILKKLLKGIVGLDLPYNYYFHQIVNDEDQHLYLKITPRGSVWAGVEIGSGLVINPVSPEDAAQYYRASF